MLTLEQLAKIQAKAFRYAKGLSSEHSEYLIQQIRKNRLTLNDLLVSPAALFENTTSAKILTDAFRKIHGRRWRRYVKEEGLVMSIIKEMDISTRDALLSEGRYSLPPSRSRLPRINIPYLQEDVSSGLRAFEAD